MSDERETAAAIEVDASVGDAKERDASDAEESDVAAPPSRTWLRMGALVLLTVVLVGIAHATGMTEHMTRDAIRETMLELGALGFLAYLGIFAIGELVHVPGMVFVAAAILAYGRGYGFLAALAGAVVSCTISFWVIRGIGGQPLGKIRWAWVRNVLAHVDRRPIRIIAVLRAIFWLAPALNYALAMSKVRFRDFLIGSVLGLLPPLAVAALAFEWLFE